VIVSVVITSAVAFLILGPRPEGLEGTLDVSALPHINAALNSLTTLLLILAFLYIKKGNIPVHKKLMLGAFTTSTLFLTTYVIYHWFKAGPRAYVGDFLTFYRVVLVSHIVLAALILPVILLTLYRGWHMQVDKHRAIAKIAFPAWIYVSVTGVMVYAMLY
jgi:putative membrane protein